MPKRYFGPVAGIKRAARKARHHARRVKMRTGIPKSLRLAYRALARRTGKKHAYRYLRTDMALRGRIPAKRSTWKKHPNRYDWKGIDYGSVRRRRKK